MQDLPSSLAGTKHPFNFGDLPIGTTFELRFHGQTIRRGVVLYLLSATTTWVFYPHHFKAKLVRGEMPVGHCLFEGIADSRVPDVEIHPLGPAVFDSFIKTLPFALRVHFGVPRATSAEARRQQPSRQVSNPHPLPTSVAPLEVAPLAVAPLASGSLPLGIVVEQPSEMQWGSDITFQEVDELPFDMVVDYVFRKPREYKKAKNSPTTTAMPLVENLCPGTASPAPPNGDVPQTSLNDVVAALRENTATIVRVCHSISKAFDGFSQMPN